MIGYLTSRSGTIPRLDRLLADGGWSGVRGAIDRPVSGIATDSRRVSPGEVFFALPGAAADEAVDRGAAAVVTQRIPMTTPARVTFVQVADPAAALARAARCLYRYPDRELRVVGVAGGPGKTTVAHLLQHFLGREKRAGLLGSIEYDLGVRRVPAHRATPEATDVFGLLSRMREAGCRDAVLEVSASGIEQRSVLGLEFGAMVVLRGGAAADGGEPEDPLGALRRISPGPGAIAPRIAVVGAEGGAGAEGRRGLPAGVRRVTFGPQARAMFRSERVEVDGDGARFDLVWPGGRMPVVSPLLGRHNAENLVAALAAAWALGVEPSRAAAMLADFGGVPGRMERVAGGRRGRVVVDLARSDEALTTALRALREITPGRVLAVFGDGDSRDRAGRIRRVRRVQAQADFAVGTVDNPQGESVRRILGDMEAGVVAPERIAWIEDRRRAIRVALAMARPEDAVLVAGRGHERFQNLGETVVPCDDRQVARELMAGEAKL
jgi:UDP-N-acetylmuramoyl-L-alanyl-D-glutamate--2,6-diaminopimelate ligase